MPIHAQQLAGFASGGIVFDEKSVVMHPLEGPVLWTHSWETEMEKNIQQASNRHHQRGHNKKSPNEKGPLSPKLKKNMANSGPNSLPQA